MKSRLKNQVLKKRPIGMFGNLKNGFLKSQIQFPTNPLGAALLQAIPFVLLVTVMVLA